MTRPDPEFIAEIESLQGVYLSSDDPIEQSGFSGGRERWVTERSPIVEAIDRDGDFLDVGCANGLLLEDIVVWAASAGHAIVPYGVDIGSDLIELAKRRLPRFAANFVAADAWRWAPKRCWDHVFSLVDLGPDDLGCEWLARLAGWVAPGGRLIIGSYGSRSRGVEPVDVAFLLERCGYHVTGETLAGEPPISRFAWTDP
ncbi:MAG TPA: class I SAM-dependent methyltransferase [Acidimicrobiia bacterium]|nr:class I SAM-dependent methyltransferase [Acidimicrobiia bacterium]